MIIIMMMTMCSASSVILAREFGSIKRNYKSITKSQFSRPFLSPLLFSSSKLPNIIFLNSSNNLFHEGLRNGGGGGGGGGRGEKKKRKRVCVFEVDDAGAAS